MLPKNTIVMPNRGCGKVRPGLYAGGRPAAGGTLKTIALPAPHPAEILSPNTQVQVSSHSLEDLAGLYPGDRSKGRYKGLPPIAWADLFGQVYYKEAWDALNETLEFGPNRRVAQVPDLPLPIPLFMMHKRAVVESPMEWEEIAAWLHKNVGMNYFRGWALNPYPEDEEQGGEPVFMDDQPWREARTLARAGTTCYTWHPHVEFWAILSRLRKERKIGAFTRECQIKFSPGVFGISWITEVRYVMGEGEEDVPEEYKRQGVLPAIGVEDDRAKEIVSEKEIARLKGEAENGKRDIES